MVTMTFSRLCLFYMLVYLVGCIGGATTSSNQTTVTTDPLNTTDTSFNQTTAVLGLNITTTEDIATSSSTAVTITSSSTAAPKPDPDPKLIKEHNLHFSIRYPNDVYEEVLNNKSSLQYNGKSNTYKHKIESYFAGVEEFQNITSLNFRNGSLIVDFTANFKYNESVQDKNYVYSKLLQRVTKKLAQDTDVDLTYSLPLLVRSVQGVDVCHLQKCERGYTCSYDSGTPACIRVPCDLSCGNGVCEFNAQNTPFCRCSETSSILYYGESCEKSVERFDLKKDYIIAIAAGVGGGVVLILSIVIIVTCLMKQKTKVIVKEPVDERDNRSEQSFESMKDQDQGDLREPYKINQAMTDPTFRRNDRNITGNHTSPYTIPASQTAPGLRGSGPYDMTLNTISEYQYNGVRSQVDDVEMRRPSRVRVVDDIENNPDYNRRESRARDSIDGANFRKNSNYNILPQRRRSSALDMRANNMTRNPLFGLQQSRRKSSVFSEIEDNYSKSTMYQPGNNNDFPKRPATSPRVFDYYNRKDSTVVGTRPSVPDIYDYEEESNTRYAYKKPPQVPITRRY